MTRAWTTVAIALVVITLGLTALWQVFTIAADGLRVDIPTVPARSVRVAPEQPRVFPPTTCTPAGACITETPAVVTRPTVLQGAAG